MDIPPQDITHPQQLPWGFWPTIGFSVLTIIISEFTKLVVGVAFGIMAKIQHPDIVLLSLESSGLVLAAVTCVSTPFTIAASLFFARLRKTISIKEYFCLYSQPKRQYFKWGLATLVFALCSDSLSFILGRPVPEFWLNAYKTAYFTPLLWFAVIIAAPPGEEILFRGFLFKGLQNSRIGSIGAILVSSLGWSALHIQYDWYGMGTIFVGGLLLGTARLKGRSIYLPIMMHGIWSLIAIAEAAIYVGVISK